MVLEHFGSESAWEAVGPTVRIQLIYFSCLYDDPFVEPTL